MEASQTKGSQERNLERGLRTGTFEEVLTRGFRDVNSRRGFARTDFLRTRILR